MAIHRFTVLLYTAQHPLSVDPTSYPRTYPALIAGLPKHATPAVLARHGYAFKLVARLKKMLPSSPVSYTLVNGVHRIKIESDLPQKLLLLFG